MQQSDGLLSKVGEKGALEPRARWPRGAPCAGPHALIRGPGVRVHLDVSYTSWRKHLPGVAIRKAV